MAEQADETQRFGISFIIKMTRGSGRIREQI
jgi:hypothetical protein